MGEHTPTAGSFVPTIRPSMRFSMAGDDCSLHFDLHKLTPKQQQDHQSNQVLTAMLQVALCYIGRPGIDEVCLYDTFLEPPWNTVLDRYLKLFAIAGLDPAQPASFHPVDGFYESVANQKRSAELENLYMISGSNRVLHQSEERLAVSRNLNSKLHFADNAPAFGLPVPATLRTTKHAVQADTDTFMTTHGSPVMLKTLGLAGARNVFTVSSPQEAVDLLQEYSDDFDVILQKRLDTDAYTEMTVDLCVADDHSTITNVRQIVFADGLWVGNLLGPTVSLTQEAQQTLLRVADYARHHGYASKHGYNLGIDFFVRNKGADRRLPPIQITEINARWTGGLFPAELIRRLRIESQPVLAFIDMCPPADLDTYLSFVEDSIYTGTLKDFAMVPMGFAPFPMEVDGTQQLFVWQIVIGDFEAFRKVRAETLGPDVLPTVPKISITL